MISGHERHLAAISSEPLASRLDTALEIMLIGLLAFMPLALGGVAAWSEMIIVSVAGAMAVCLAVRFIVHPEARVVRTWAYVPILLFLALAALQLVPLPRAAVETISPNTALTKASLLDDLPDGDDVLGTMTLSFYPWATRHDLRLVLVAVVVFVVVVNVYRRDDQIKRLLASIAIIGAGIAGLALAQIVSRTDRIYWIYPTGHEFANAGTFINHSHYAQFTNLSMAAAFGLLLVKIHESFGRVELTPSAVVDRLRHAELRVVWYLVGMLAVCAATVFASLSRGGVISMLIAGGFTGLLFSATGGMKGSRWIMVAASLGGFICVLYIGFDAVYERLATLRDLDDAFASRGQILRDIAVAWTKFPVVGTGLGTHEVVYPMFDRANIAALAGHAENEYAQAAEETGLIGWVSLVFFAVVVGAAHLGNIRKARGTTRVMAHGLAFGLLAVMIHSLSDFGQHLPANACLSAVMCGLLVGMSRRDGRDGRSSRRGGNVALARALRLGGLFLVIGVSLWAVSGAYLAFAAESSWRTCLKIENTLREDGWLGTNEEYTRLLSSAEQAAAVQPDNVHYRHWLNVYRWRAVSRVTDDETGELVVTDKTLEYAERIVEELHQARALCPTFGPTYSVVGQLEKFVLQRDEGADRIRKGYGLFPGNGAVCYAAGLLDALEGEIDASLYKLRRALDLDRTLLADVTDVYVHRIGRPDLAVTVVGNDVHRLTYVARVLQESAKHGGLAAEAKARVTDLLEAACAAPDAPATSLASLAGIYLERQDYPKAIEFYQRALLLEYDRVYWRLSLARALSRAGRRSEAVREARRCLSLRPQMTAARTLIEQLSGDAGG